MSNGERGTLEGRNKLWREKEIGHLGEGLITELTLFGQGFEGKPNNKKVRKGMRFRGASN